ncbi:MAG: aminopeptidase [Syntrophales bacterium]|jgi:aminopeptidase|nr:aminopeptidase [Syntrophales bacterium]MDY0043317.1 aminopeptidase [Syntrophales bacterium]
MRKKHELAAEHIERYADVLLWGLKTARSLSYKAGDIVLLRFDHNALPLAEALYDRLIDMKLHAIPRMGQTPRMEYNFFSRASKRQLVFHPPGDSELMRALNGTIYLHAPESLTHLADIDSKKIGTALVARKPLREILVKREEQGLYGWTLCTYPTAELAKQAGLSFERYSRQIIKACFLDHENPLKQWNEIFKEAEILKKWLNSLNIRSIRLESKETDLTINPGRQRKWIGVSGHNIPSFEIFISPDWRGSRGSFYANQPSFRNGNYAEGIRLVFEKGSVISASAEKGETFLKEQIAIDKGACRIGEFSLTDRRFSRITAFMADTLFDENFGGRFGNCHIALGSSYSDTYDGEPGTLTKQRKKQLGFNDSALHWDLVNTENKRVTAKIAGGRTVTIYENGIFTL